MVGIPGQIEAMRAARQASDRPRRVGPESGANLPQERAVSSRFETKSFIFFHASIPKLPIVEARDESRYELTLTFW
jgi:hypothetical protein